jgi:hypothetical protein
MTSLAIQRPLQQQHLEKLLRLDAAEITRAEPRPANVKFERAEHANGSRTR